MKPTSATQHSTVISLPKGGYSVHQIESKTGLGRSTVGRIKKKTDLDKENSKGGCPSKLSSHDTQSIICQITTGKLDNAVQAAHFINDIFPSLINPQTVRNALKERNFCSVVKQKQPLILKPREEIQSINLNYNRGSKNCPNKSLVCLIYYTISSHQNVIIKGLFLNYYIEV